MRGSFNRSGDQQRKITHKEGIIDKVVFGFDSFVININDIGQAVKRIKRNSHGKHDFQQKRGGFQSETIR